MCEDLERLLSNVIPKYLTELDIKYFSIVKVDI